MPSLFFVLLRSESVKEAGDDCEDYVWQPEGDYWWKSVGVNEHLAESQEENVGKCQGNTDTDVPADTSASLF